MTDINDYIEDGKLKTTAYIRACFEAGEPVTSNELLDAGVNQQVIYATFGNLRSKQGMNISSDRDEQLGTVYRLVGAKPKPRETPAEAGRRIAQAHMQEVLRKEAEASVALDGETQSVPSPSVPSPSVPSWPMPTPVTNGVDVPPLGTALTVAGAYLDEDGSLQLALRNGAGSYLVRLIGHT